MTVHTVELILGSRVPRNSHEVTAALEEEASAGSEAYLRSYGNHSARSDICPAFSELLDHYQTTTTAIENIRGATCIFDAVFQGIPFNRPTVAD